MKASLVPIVLAGVIGLYQLRRRRLAPELRYVLALTALSLVTELVSRLLWLRHQPNLFLLPIYTAGECMLLLLLYRQVLDSARFSRLVPWLLGGFGLYTLLSSLAAADLVEYNSVQRVVESVLVLGCVILFFRKLLNELTVENLGREPMFWVSVGVLIYFVGNVHIFLFSNFLKGYSHEFNLTVWAIHAALYMVLYCCYCLALWRLQKN